MRGWGGKGDLVPNQGVRATSRWSHGERGPLVEGRAAELVSVLGNRPKPLPRLVGDGVAVLESRLSLPTRTAG